MPERQSTPPTRKPVSEFPTPDPSVAFFTELVNRDDPAYMANAPVKRGQLYANMVGAKREVIATYPTLFFLRERKFQLSDQQVLWDWATDEQAENTYNSEVTYVANAVTYPAFTRTYTMRRELWEADPTKVIGSPLPGIVAVEITSPGQNHTTATGVIDSTTVAIEFTVDATGGLMNGVITNTGNELIQNGTAITIIGDGQDSSAVAVTQPIGCVLTAQKKEEFPDDSPYAHELVKVTRVYETLPGPWLYTTKIDKDGMFVTTKTRRQVSDFITDNDEILNGEWIQTWHKDTDNFVAEETIEVRPVPGNPIINTKVAEDGKILTTTKTLVDTTTLVSSETLSIGIWTKNSGQEVDDSTLIKVHQASYKVSWQISEARDVPGNPMVSTRVEEDGIVTTITKTLKSTSVITSGEIISGGNWIKTHKEEVSDLVAYEVVESRPVPGNPLVNTKIEEDGITMTITKIIGDTSLIVSSEVISGGFWVRTYKEEVSDLVAYQVQETRAIPGNSVKSTRVDEDGVEVDVTKTLRQTTTITTQETLALNVWTKEHAEAVSDIVAWDVIEIRAIPGNPIPDSELDKDGTKIDIALTMKAASAITTQETLVLGVWTRTESDPITDLVSWEKVTARALPGNIIPSANVDQDHEIANISTRLRSATLITPSVSEAGGFVTEVEQKEVSDLVSDEVTTVKRFLDAAFYSISIINLIPREFMAEIPTKVESHVLSGTASQPTIGSMQFEVSEKQLTKLLYERRVTTIDAPSLPITHTNYETTEQYGGGVINVNYTLDLLGSQAIDSGLLVISSSLTDLGNGLVVKDTRVLPSGPWPSLSGTDLDEVHLATLPFTKQVVAAGSTGGIVGSVYTKVDPIDYARSESIATTVPSDLSSLNRDYATVVNHAFPDTLIDATLDYAGTNTNGFQTADFGLSYTLLRGYRGACDGHIYEVYTNGVPTSLPTVTKFFPQSAMRTISFASVCADSSDACSGRSFARVWEFEFPMSLHAAITVTNTGSTMTIPATTPTALPVSGTEITVDIQTERWKYGIYITKIINVLMP